MSNRNNRTPLASYQAPELDRKNVSVDLLADMMNSTTISDPNEPDELENQKIDWEKERDELDHYFDQQSKVLLKRLPRYSKPKGFKPSTKLYHHQKDGVRFLIGQELDPSPNPFYRVQKLQDGSEIFFDRFTTRRKLPQPYFPVKGAVLADGKYRFARIIWMKRRILLPNLIILILFVSFPQRWVLERRCRLLG